MVTKGLTKRQREEGVLSRIRFSKAQIKQFNNEHKKFEGEILDDCYIGDEPWIDYFETYYLAEYSSFSKPFVLSRRIKEFRAGKQIIYNYQVVYKTNNGRNAPSPVRQYLREVHQKIDEAFGGRAIGTHLERHLDYKIFEKHRKSLQEYVRAKKHKGEIK
jgi:hypothetical protein